MLSVSRFRSLLRPLTAVVRHQFRTTANQSAAQEKSSKVRPVLAAIVITATSSFIAHQVTADATEDLKAADVEEYKYVIVGGGAAAHYAVTSIRERDPGAKVIVFSQDSNAPYPRPPLSKTYWFQDTAEKRKRVFYYPKQVYSGNVTLMLNTPVVSLDVNKKEVVLANGKHIRYDKVLLATGGRPKTLNDIPGVKVGDDVSRSMTTFRNINDYTDLLETTSKAKDVVVLGGGLLGSELVCALSHVAQSTGTKTHQVFPESGVLANYLPPFLSSYTTSRLHQDAGIDIRASTFVTEITRLKSGRLQLVLDNGSAIEADHIVCALGILPNNVLAKNAGLELDVQNGGIIVNSELEARRDVFVAGDVCSYHDVVLGRRRVEHQDHAERSGLRAGYNMTGERQPYTYQSLCWSSLGDIRWEACGIVDPTLETVSVWATKKSDNAPGAQPDAPAIIETDPYKRGVVYYMKGKKVVGVLLWNVRDKGENARNILSGGKEWTKAEISAQIPV